MIDLKANFRDFNPLAPKIDWFLNSPHSITLESNVKVVRIKEMITSLGRSWLSSKFSLSVAKEM